MDWELNWQDSDGVPETDWANQSEPFSGSCWEGWLRMTLQMASLTWKLHHVGSQAGAIVSRADEKQLL